MTVLRVLLGFLRVGCFAFGGAYGAIPLIRDVVKSNGWLTDGALLDMIAVSESTPGPIMVNMATYVGATQAGLWGSLVATLGVVLPAFLIIVLLSASMKNWMSNKYVQAALRGLKPCVIGIVLATGIYMALRSVLGDDLNVFDLRGAILTVILGAILFGVPKVFHKKVSPILLIVIGAALGLVVFAI